MSQRVSEEKGLLHIQEVGVYPLLRPKPEVCWAEPHGVSRAGHHWGPELQAVGDRFLHRRVSDLASQCALTALLISQPLVWLAHPP